VSPDTIAPEALAMHQPFPPRTPLRVSTRAGAGAFPIAPLAAFVALAAISAAPSTAAEAPETVAPTRRPAVSVDADAIRAIGKQWMVFYQAGNYAAIPELYTEDAVIMARGRPRMEGRAALRQSIGKLAAGRKVAIDITERELEVRGDVAWFVSDFKVTYTPPDAASPPKVEYGRSMLIYLRGADGRWRIHRDMDSPAPAPPPATAPAALTPD
jgi:uncharacterized protein (TIGR02246 family)